MTNAPEEWKAKLVRAIFLLEGPRLLGARHGRLQESIQQAYEVLDDLLDDMYAVERPNVVILKAEVKE